MPDPQADGDVFGALADPTRRAILQAVVRQGPVSASALADSFPISRQGIAKHLTVLRNAGLVTARRDGRETCFSARTQPLRTVSSWVEQVDRAWERRLDALARTARRDRRR